MGRLTKNEFESNFLQSIIDEASEGVEDFVLDHVKHAQKNTTTLTPLEQIKSVTDSYASPADFKVGGNTLYNAIVNGDFRNGTTGWSANISTLSVLDRKIIVTGTGAIAFSGVLSSNIYESPSNKSFAKCKVKVTNNECNLLILQALYYNSSGTVVGEGINSTISNPVADKWYDISSVFTHRTQSDWQYFRLRIQMRYPDASTANGKVMEVDGNAGVFAIPITGTPYENYTADQMNALVNEYFEGLKSVNKMEILSRGRNLFDGELESGRIHTNTGLNMVDTTRIRTKNHVRIKPNTGYYFARYDAILGTDIYFYDRNKNLISSSEGSTLGSISRTTPVNAAYVRWSLRGTTDIASQVQLNEGSTPLPYEPFQGSKAKITCTDETKFTLAKLNSGIKNEILMGDGKWRAIKRMDYGVTIDHTLNWGVSGTQPSSDGWKVWASGYFSALNHSLFYGKVRDSNNNFEYDLSTTIGHNGITTGRYGTSAGTDFHITIPKTLIGTSEPTTIQIQQYFQTNPHVITYELATPITIEEKDFAQYGIQVEGQLATNTGYTEFVVNDYDIFSDLEAEYSVNVAKAVEKLKNGQLTETEFRQKQNLINLEFDARLSLLEI